VTNVIVAFPKPEDAKSIRNILVKNGFPVVAVCTSGAQTLQYADDLHNGVVVCGYRLTDMIYSQLREDLSEQFDMLLLASRRFTSEVDDKRIRCVAMPLKVHELLASVDAAVEESELRKKKARQQPKQRNVFDKQQIMLAKDLLMNVLAYHPFVIKPNNHELSEIFDIMIDSKEKAVVYAKELQKKGAQNVIVSMAGEGAVFVGSDGSVFISEAPHGVVKNSVGAGDSMVAGFLAGYLAKGDYAEAFKMGLCTGSASAFSDQLATREEVEQVRRSHIFDF